MLGCAETRPAESHTFPVEPLVVVMSRSGELELTAWTAPLQPPTRGMCSVKLAIEQVGSGAAVSGLELEVVPEMPSMGHGTPTVPKSAETGPGTYRVTDVNLFMAGRWDLRITLSGAREDYATISVDVR
jgi:hypothetical protein